MKYARLLTGLVFALLLVACGEPLVIIAPGARTTAVKAATPPAATATTVATATTKTYNAQEPHAYEGDLANSITIQDGDIFRIHNPDFTKSYSFKVVKVTAEDITITCDDPSVKIKNVGFTDGSLLLAFSLDGTFTKPIGWARYTPKEHIPVVQFYSIAAGGFIERGQQDDG